MPCSRHASDAVRGPLSSSSPGLIIIVCVLFATQNQALVGCMDGRRPMAGLAINLARSDGTCRPSVDGSSDFVASNTLKNLRQAAVYMSFGRHSSILCCRDWQVRCNNMTSAAWGKEQESFTSAASTERAVQEFHSLQPAHL